MDRSLAGAAEHDLAPPRTIERQSRDIGRRGIVTRNDTTERGLVVGLVGLWESANEEAHATGNMEVGRSPGLHRTREQSLSQRLPLCPLVIGAPVPSQNGPIHGQREVRFIVKQGLVL